MQFNRTPLALGGSIDPPTQHDIKNAAGLWRASAEDALLYGGPLVRAALGAMNLRNDRRYVVVDTKIHMLMPGFLPAIPGWHTDGAPRGVGPDKMNPAGPAPPDLRAQEGVERPPRFHLLVTGFASMTEFVTTPNLELTVPYEPTPDLYRLVTQQVNALAAEGRIDTIPSPSCQVIEWDWWALHRGVQATQSEWRFLIRVTETDFLQPNRDLRSILRNQSQVYVSLEYGW